MIDISVSDSYDIRGNYTIFFDEILVITQQLNMTADYDESIVQFSRNHHLTPDHNVMLNLSISILSGSSCNIGILKDWSLASDVWLIIGGSAGIGFIIYMLFVLGSAQGGFQRTSKPAPDGVDEIPTKTPAFCPHCGLKLPVVGERCPTCGQAIISSSKEK